MKKARLQSKLADILRTIYSCTMGQNHKRRREPSPFNFHYEIIPKGIVRALVMDNLNALHQTLKRQVSPHWKRGIGHIDQLQVFILLVFSNHVVQNHTGHEDIRNV